MPKRKAWFVENINPHVTGVWWCRSLLVSERDYALQKKRCCLVMLKRPHSDEWFATKIVHGHITRVLDDTLYRTAYDFYADRQWTFVGNREQRGEGVPDFVVSPFLYLKTRREKVKPRCEQADDHADYCDDAPRPI
jgi:hypothetical protein